MSSLFAGIKNNTREVEEYAVVGEHSPSLFAGIKNNTREVEECAVVVYFPSRFAGILFPTRIVGWVLRVVVGDRMICAPVV